MDKYKPPIESLFSEIDKIVDGLVIRFYKMTDKRWGPHIVSPHFLSNELRSFIEFPTVKNLIMDIFWTRIHNGCKHTALKYCLEIYMYPAGQEVVVLVRII